MLNKLDDIKQLVSIEIEKTKDSISARAQNIIDSLLQFNPTILFDYVYGFEDIIALRNVGKKTQYELNIYFENIKKSIEKIYNIEVTSLNFTNKKITLDLMHTGEGINQNLKIIKTRHGMLLEEDLHEFESYKETVKNFFKICKSQLSNRAIHFLEQLINHQFQTFLEYVYSIRDIQQIRNIGVITLPEFEAFFANIRKLITEQRDNKRISILQSPPPSFGLTPFNPSLFFLL